MKIILKCPEVTSTLTRPEPCKLRLVNPLTSSTFSYRFGGLTFGNEYSVPVMPAANGRHSIINFRNAEEETCLAGDLPAKSFAAIAGGDSNVTVRALEIYNNQVHDLLSDFNKPVQKNFVREDLKISASAANVGVLKATMTSVGGKEELDEVVKHVVKVRSSATIDNQMDDSTRMNTSINSSGSVRNRGHVIITLFAGSAKINIFDLACAENNRTNENIGIRMEESNYINKSLFELGQLIQSINSGAKIIPFRDSKLGKLMMDSVSSESCLICTLCGEEERFQVDYKTVQFAHKAKGKGGGTEFTSVAAPIATTTAAPVKRGTMVAAEEPPASKKQKIEKVVENPSKISQLTPVSKAAAKGAVGNANVAEKAGRLDSAVKHMGVAASLLPKNEKIAGKIKSLNEMIEDAAKDPEKVQMADILNQALFSPTAKTVGGNMAVGPMRVAKMEVDEEVEKEATEKIASTPRSTNISAAPQRVNQEEDVCAEEVVTEKISSTPIATKLSGTPMRIVASEEVEVEKEKVAVETKISGTPMATKLSGTPSRVVVQEATEEAEETEETEGEKMEVDEPAVAPVATVKASTPKATKLSGTPSRVVVQEAEEEVEKKEEVEETPFNDSTEEVEKKTEVDEPAVAPVATVKASTPKATKLSGTPSRVVVQEAEEEVEEDEAAVAQEQVEVPKPVEETQIINDENSTSSRNISTPKKTNLAPTPSRVVLGETTAEMNVPPPPPSTTKQTKSGNGGDVITVLNSGDYDKLITLVGIGPAKAKAIIEELTNGPFEHSSDLSRIGMSQKMIFKFTANNLEERSSE